MSYRLFVGQLVRDVRRREIEDAFGKFGEIVRIDIKNGFGFIEYAHSRDADEAIRKMDGEDFLGRRIIVEHARGKKRERSRERDRDRDRDRRRENGPERSDYRVIVEGLGRSTSWQDLKDAFRSSGDILFTDVRRDRYDEYYGIVEFRYKEDIDHAIKKMDGAEVNGHKIKVKEDRKKARSGSRDKKKRSSSRERSGSRDRKKRSPTPTREKREGSEERKSPGQGDKERGRSGSREPEKREGSEGRDKKRSRSPEEKREEDDRDNKRSKQDEEKHEEKDNEEN